ncbi:MAG TPA: N-6 DNA methylase [Methylomusa anaerophila]|uniref:site-specific DNA-methyltransferase (adenine-specific) n=1 Tax=Methylomusa anaerophila TaxID=1930071 RepID=A0A348AFM4_9FIRM|nr:N-6 DNA methylase [Methylomusa anaerophila]BBB89872.1 modification methylase PaeR7I [Methylomusa anaerophila]HML89081.1 N-6 DNA methylase [Methylomusa anaerophila]
MGATGFNTKGTAIITGLYRELVKFYINLPQQGRRDARLVHDVACRMIIKMLIIRLCREKGCYKDSDWLDFMVRHSLFQISRMFAGGIPVPDEDPSADFFQLEPFIRQLGKKLDRLDYCFADDFFRHPALLGEIYEQIMERATQKAAGRYYTPNFVISYILENTLSAADVVANPFVRVLDPACGTGNFLLSAYDLLKKKFAAALPALQAAYADQEYEVEYGNGQKLIKMKGLSYWNETNLHYHILRHCLYGADIDGFAAEIAAVNFLLKGSSPPANLNIIACDSLLRWENGREDSGNNRENNVEKKRRFWSQRYDYVVGNPPYVSFGLNRTGVLNAGYTAYIRANYQHSAEYKISYYALFIQRALEVLTSGGRLGFITPDSYLLGRYFSKIRRYILDNCLIEEILLLSQPVFAGATIGIPTISILTKIHKPEQKETHEVKVAKMQENGQITAFRYSQTYFHTQSYYRFRMFFNKMDKTIVEKMDQAGNKLGDLARIKTGMRSLTSQQEIKSQQPHGPTWKRGLTSSAQVIPFLIEYRGDWLDVNPDKLNKGGWDKAIIENPKILLRQTGDSLIAAIDRNGYYHLNNLHSISLSGGLTSLEYIVCLLNSRLMNYYYQTISLEKGRSLAQTDIETLEKLPIVLNPLIKKELESMTLSLEGSAGRYFQSSPSFELLSSSMNYLIYDLYGLSRAEVQYVEESAQSARLRKRGRPPSAVRH